MQIQLDDIMKEMYAEFPELKESSIKRICTKGLRGIIRVMRGGDELFISGDTTELKFFIPMTVEDQSALMTHRYHKHKARKEYGTTRNRK